ncbi:protein of unknown function DUF86 [Ignisphaera aggregans DSM 17230]|uniref:Polymerase beta nucleotidyltransferase domain-containing protein n=1 Tax=Ignisphaera aggregans (strain DSM 17230 / JCM 13409 / AQ1.S1) TaxID=583356 RepID=E0STD0_IGNAA|nr:protein of unknown function DUF86 [Ignisphaera aggregans DSM 17230]
MGCVKFVYRNLVLERLVELFRGLSYVEVAILFGSFARGEPFAHDIDIAVKFSGGGGLFDLGLLVSRIAEVLGVGEECVDVVDLDSANPILLFRILSEGILLKGGEEALRILAERASLYPDILMEIKMWSNLDPDPKPDVVIISSRVEEIRRNVNFIRSRILSRKPEELDYGDILAFERALHRTIEAMLDICRHLVSVYSLGLVESYGEYPRKLAQAGIMPRELAEEIVMLTGLRNILVHRYLEIDIGKLYTVAKQIVERIAIEFIDWIRAIVKADQEVR